jgi:hypothetical protein
MTGDREAKGLLVALVALAFAAGCGTAADMRACRDMCEPKGVESFQAARRAYMGPDEPPVCKCRP